ncbi:hypothetical protein AA0472_0105 [Acetobacter estunensis NRIC 0472]|uniref:Glycosyl transferase family 2 n=1 Tax=Acetobacter estunensis TaxID=104097 RepID=A0A967B7L8_9PROT|nr:glycosyltransferase family 2 protein [Acetobacter estunensis]NHO53551.1 hypothetical protein [Acetobacter estunensis]GBQ20324.1 hypothetical protein AA0472_0105 [Acetobacter estunensis NRIC 0472]
MARVKCVMMQRDETLLLEPWFRHYGHLFGFENLVVLDNGSIEPDVLATLDRYARAGAQVVRGLGRTMDFEAKGQYVRQIIEHWDTEEDYDFALPVDCDEFLATYTAGGLSCARGAIHATLDALIGEQRAMQIRFNPANVPGVAGGFLPMDFPKKFVARGTVGEVDLGYHAITSRVAEGFVETTLAYLHMHNKPFPMLVEHAARKLRDRVDVTDKKALKSFVGAGMHLIDYFFMTEEDYLARFANGVFLRFPGVVNHFGALGVCNAFFGTLAPMEPERPLDLVELVEVVDGQVTRSRPFDAQAYMALHADVAASDMSAFYHYCAFGMLEGRGIG